MNFGLEDTRKKREQLAQLQRVADLKELIELPAGKRFFFDLIDRRCAVAGSSFTAQGRNAPLKIAFQEGMREVGIAVMRELQEVAPESFVAMLKERYQDANAEAALRKREAVPNAGDGRTS